MDESPQNKSGPNLILLIKVNSKWIKLKLKQSDKSNDKAIRGKYMTSAMSLV